MTHLGERVGDLVDGQLCPQAAEDAARHLVGCAACRHEVDAARLIKRRLAGLGAPEPSGDLMARLVGLGGPEGPVAPRPEPMPQGWRPATVAMPPRMSLVGQRRPAARRPVPLSPAAAWRPPARSLAVTMGALSLASVGMIAAAGAAGGPEPTPVPGRPGPVANLVVPVGLRSAGPELPDPTSSREPRASARTTSSPR